MYKMYKKLNLKNRIYFILGIILFIWMQSLIFLSLFSMIGILNIINFENELYTLGSINAIEIDNSFLIFLTIIIGQIIFFNILTVFLILLINLKKLNNSLLTMLYLFIWMFSNAILALCAFYGMINLKMEIKLPIILFVVNMLSTLGLLLIFRVLGENRNSASLHKNNNISRLIDSFISTKSKYLDRSRTLNNKDKDCC